MKNEGLANGCGCLALGVFTIIMYLCQENIIHGFWNKVLAFVIAGAVFIIGAIVTKAITRDRYKDRDDREGY